MINSWLMNTIWMLLLLSVSVCVCVPSIDDKWEEHQLCSSRSPIRVGKPIIGLTTSTSRRVDTATDRGN
jgi:hypothetical protein